MRLIKLLGDEVMLVSPDARKLVDAVETMLDASERDPTLPSLRAGIAVGPALQQGGDYYGNTVNLASRITDEARNLGALATAEAVAAADDDRWERGPCAQLKGITDPVQLHRLVRGDARSGAASNSA